MRKIVTDYPKQCGVRRRRARTLGSVNPTVFTALRARCETIDQRWHALLHEQHARQPLARPLGLAFWIPKALQRIFGYLEHAEPVDGIGSLQDFGCSCGTNPYLAFYSAGEQALLEGLTAVLPDGAPAEEEQRLRRCVQCALSRLALRDIEQFCRVCVHGSTCAHRRGRSEAADRLGATRSPRAATATRS